MTTQLPCWVPRQPPCLVHGQHFCDARVVIILARIEVGERLPVGVNYLEATRQGLDGPRRREATVGHCSRLEQKGRRPKPRRLTPKEKPDPLGVGSGFKWVGVLGAAEP